MTSLARWTVGAPMLLEAVALRRGLAALSPAARGTVAHTGVGPRRARRAAARDLAQAPAIAVAGVGGGLSADLHPGDVVVASEVRADPRTTGVVPAAVTMPAAAMLAASLRRRGLRVHLGPVVTTDRLANGPDRARLAATGALVADVESAWLLSGHTGRPLACVRVVADTVGGLYRLGTLRHLRAALRVLPAVSAALAEWAAATTVRGVVLASPRSCSARGMIPAVRQVAAGADVVLVIGSANSSNSRRVVEVAERAGAHAHLVDDVGYVDLRWLAGATTVGVTAGASAPPHLVDELVSALTALGARHVAEHAGTVEDVHFTLPKEVRQP